jgi:NADH-quinone oxidoreductase subunit C
MSKKVLERLQQTFGDAIRATHDQHGDETAVVDPDRWVEIARFVRDDDKCRMDHFIDLTAVDHLGRREPRFEVVLHVRSQPLLHRIRLKAPSEGHGDEPPSIDSLVEVWRGANWFERECYDMFGIVFRGHPDLRRILLYPEFEGHPLRKDYPADRTQPLCEYRPAAIDRLAPFDATEGMPFARRAGARPAPGKNRLGLEEEG